MMVQRFFKHAVLTISALSLGPASAFAEEAEDIAVADPGLVDRVLPTETWSDRFEWEREEFHYQITILGDVAASCSFVIGQMDDHPEHGRVLEVQASASSVGFFGMVYPMADTAVTYIDPSDGLPVTTQKVIDERNNRRIYTVEYNHDGFLMDVTRFRNGNAGHYSRYSTSDMHDAVSWVVDLRSRDFSVGSEYVYHIYDGWKLSRLTARVEQHTDVYTPNGFVEVAEFSFTREVLTSAPALPWAPQRAIPPVYDVTDGPTNLGVGWFSLDDTRLPVGVAISTPIGDLEMIIEDWIPPGSGQDLGIRWEDPEGSDSPPDDEE